jgi:hypothetical protein
MVELANKASPISDLGVKAHPANHHVTLFRNRRLKREPPSPADYEEFATFTRGS